jgi:hypothetical protein
MLGAFCARPRAYCIRLGTLAEVLASASNLFSFDVSVEKRQAASQCGIRPVNLKLISIAP